MLTPLLVSIAMAGSPEPAPQVERAWSDPLPDGALVAYGTSLLGTSHVADLAWSPDDELVYAAHAWDGVVAWDPGTGKPVRKILQVPADAPSSNIGQVAVSDGWLLAVGPHRAAWVELASGEAHWIDILAPLEGFQKSVAVRGQEALIGFCSVGEHDAPPSASCGEARSSARR